MTALPLIDSASSIAQPGLLLEAVRANLDSVRGEAWVWGFWSSSAKRRDTRASLRAVTVGQRVVYEVRMAAVDDSTTFLQNDVGKVVLDIAPPTVFEFYFSDARVGPTSPEWIVVTSLAPVR